MVGGGIRHLVYISHDITVFCEYILLHLVAVSCDTTIQCEYSPLVVANLYYFLHVLFNSLTDASYVVILHFIQI